MNRAGLFIALAIALIGGVVFGIFPQFDIWLARLFYNTSSRTFVLSPLGTAEYVRRAAMWIGWAFVLPAIVALIVKLIRPEKPLLISGRAVVFLLSTILITAILLPDVVVKHHWGRPRPISTTDFNGSQSFKPWWHANVDRWQDTSFLSGEAATAFWTYAPAALAPPPLRPLAFVAASIFGLTTGILRMAFGAHYASDIIAAGVISFVVVWLGHGLIYRWRPGRLTDEEVDRWLTNKAILLRSAKTFWLLAIAVGVLTIARLIALRYSVVDLFPDEARYWFWAQTPAFGYPSKPPLLAWMIAGSTRLYGNSEAGLRTIAPLFYAGTSLVSFFVAQQLYGSRVGFWSGLSIALATGIVYSARIISTDVPLIFFWTLALLAYVKMLETPTMSWSVILGLAIGLGLLAKYAMIYFILGMAVMTFIDSRAAAFWGHRRTWFALVLALLVLAPNLIWNVAHDFATLHSTAGNVVGHGIHPNPLGLVSFLGAQFGVFGPIMFGTFFFALVRPSRFQLERGDLILITFAILPLAIVSLASLLTETKANWAAPAGVPIIIFAVAALVRQGRWRWIYLSLAIGLGFQIALFAGDAFADRISVGFLRQPDIYHRTLGWKNLAAIVRQKATMNATRSIAAEEGDVIASLRYYLRDDALQVFSASNSLKWLFSPDADRPIVENAAEPTLYVFETATDPNITRVHSGLVNEKLAHFYSTVNILGPVDVRTGPRSSRRYCLFKFSEANAATVRPGPN